MSIQENFLKIQFDKCKRFDEVYKEEHVFDEGRTCPPFFDGVLCWPSTNANQTIVQSCPLSVMGHTNATIENLKEYMMIDRGCLADGEWDIEWFWRGYELCIPNSAFYMIDSTNELKYIWDPRDVLLFTEWFPILTSISYVGYATTFATSMLAITILSLFKRFRNPTNRFHTHLFATFVMKAFMTLLSYWISVDGIGLTWDIVLDTENNVYHIREHDDITCKLVRTLWNYFLVANYSWMLMQGLYLYNLMSLKIIVNSSMITSYILMGWGLPCLVIVPWFTTYLTATKTVCWAPHEFPFLSLIIRVPIIISILVNFVLFFHIIHMMRRKMRASLRLQQKRMEYRRWARSTVILIPALGVHYLFLLGLSNVVDYDVELVWLFAHQSLTSFQGTFVAVVLCLLKHDVRAEIQRVWRTRRFTRDIFTSSISGHRNELNSRRGKNNDKQHRSEDKDTKVAVIAMKELPR